MTRFLLRRLILALLMLLVITVFVFVLSRLAGDPRYLYLSDYTTDAQWDEWGKVMGLDRPLYVQYWMWLTDVLHLDFGTSLVQKRDAMELVFERAPATLRLGASAFTFAIVVSIPLGVLSAVKRGTMWDYVARVFAMTGQAMPGFWLGIVLIMFFSVKLGWVPTGRHDTWSAYLLPTLTLGWYPAAGLLRLTRSGMLEVLDSEYVKLARAKGVRHNLVIWKHAFRNALITPFTYAGLLLAAFITGAVVTETVFAWPGLGRLGVDSVNANDFPVMAAVVLVSAVAYITGNLLIDILYRFIDPRMRSAGN